MRRVLIYPVLCLSLAVGAACSRDRGDTNVNASASQQPADVKDSEKRDQVEVTGCLTANTQTNQFVLTANATTLTSMTNRAGAGEAETFHYQLMGGENLPAYVGREVIVKGVVVGDGKDVNIETKDKADGVASKSRGEEATPAIESSEEIEMQVERLQVASVMPTGAACQIGQGQRR